MKLTLPVVRPFRKNAAHQNAWSDHYGALHVAAAYCELPLSDDFRVKGLWQHGVFGPWSNHSPRLLAYNAPESEQRPVWVARQDQAELLRANEFRQVRPVGMPILYTKSEGWHRHRGSLLVMPGHSLGGWKPQDRSAFERYADEVAAIASQFAHVTVCISPRDWRSGLWVREFGARGFDLVQGAETCDANALVRVRALCEQFETVTTNCWGSHVAYALAFGAKVSIHGTHPTIDAATIMRFDSTWRADPQALEKSRSDEIKRLEQEYLKEFIVPPTAALANRTVGDWLIGKDHQLIPEQMRAILPELIDVPSVTKETSARASASSPKILPTAPEMEPGQLPVVLIRSHEFNYSETFIEDHVNHLTRNLTLVYGCPFPRFLKGGRSVLSDETETHLKAAIAASAVTPEVWSEYSAGLSHFLKSCGADAALVESGLMGAFVHEACEQAALPYVVHFHGVDAFGKELLSQWGARYRKFFRTAAGIVAVSRAMREQLIQLGAPEDRTILGPYGVAVNLPKLAQPAQATPQFLAVGRFVEKKAPHATIQAFTAVRKKCPTARLVMIGDGPLLAVCRQLAAKNGVADAITFAGVQSREQVSAWMASSRAFVQHSVTAANGDSEGLPLAILEAGAHGLPVVATRHAGIPDAVREEVDGLLVREKDISGMAAAMLRLAEDAELAAKLGASFRERVVSHYSRRVSLERLHRILEACAERRPVTGIGVSTTVEAADERKDASPDPVALSAVDAPAEPATPGERISADRNDTVAYRELGDTLARTGDIAGAYQAFGEAHRLNGCDETKLLLEKLEERGALGEPAVEAYRRRAGWLPRRKNARPRRILMVTNLLPPQEMGGFGRTMFEFGRELVARGHTVRVLTSDMPHLERKPTAEHAAFAPHVRRTLKLIGDWKDGPVLVDSDPERLKEILRNNRQLILQEARSFNPDILVAGNLDLLGHHFLQELLDAGLPVLHRLGNAQPGYEVKDAPRSPLYCVASCSEWVNEQLRAKQYPIQRYAVLPPGSPLTDYFRAFPPRRDRLRIAFASLLMPYKGAHVLLEALAYLKHVGIPFECTPAGDSTSQDYLNKLLSFAENRGFTDALNFPGFLGKHELAALFARSNVLVFPSIFEEPFGKTQIEAMAAGLLVVSSGNGGAGEIIRDGDTGLFFKSGDARSLAEKLARAHRDPEWTARIAQAGQADAFRFTTGACVDRLESLLEELLVLARRKSPALAR